MARVKDPNKPKRSPLEGYKTYNPEEEGYGDSAQWRGAFKFRMGLDAARAAVGSKNPLVILGVIYEAGWTMIEKWKAIQSAWRKLVRACHPDLPTGDAAEFRRVQGAYEMLEDEFQRKGVI